MKKNNLIDLLSLFITHNSVRIVLFFSDDVDELIIQGEPLKLKRILEKDYGEFYVWAIEYFDNELCLSAKKGEN